MQKNKVLTAKSQEQLWGKQSLMRQLSSQEEQFYVMDGM